MRSPAEGSARRIEMARIALFIAGAFALSSFERLAPNPFPMVRLGLGNIMTLTAFAVMGVRAGIWVSAGRVMLVALVWGGLIGPTAVLSAAGAGASLLVMVPMLLAGGFSLYGVSLAGAYAHVAGQLTAASLFYVGTANLLILLPVMGVTAIVTGLFNAWVTIWLISRLPAAAIEY